MGARQKDDPSRTTLRCYCSEVVRRVTRDTRHGLLGHSREYDVGDLPPAGERVPCPVKNCKGSLVIHGGDR